MASWCARKNNKTGILFVALMTLQSVPVLHFASAQEPSSHNYSVLCPWLLEAADITPGLRDSIDRTVLHSYHFRCGRLHNIGLDGLIRSPSAAYIHFLLSLNQLDPEAQDNAHFGNVIGALNELEDELDDDELLIDIQAHLSRYRRPQVFKVTDSNRDFVWNLTGQASSSTRSCSHQNEAIACITYDAEPFTGDRVRVDITDSTAFVSLLDGSTPGKYQICIDTVPGGGWEEFSATECRIYWKPDMHSLQGMRPPEHKRVYFAFDSDEFDKDSAPDAHSVINAFAKVPHQPKLFIRAHADCLGDVGYNIDLARKRASRVKRELEKNGYPPEKIEKTIAAGEHFASARCGSQDYACGRDDRFVEIKANSGWKAQAYTNDNCPGVKTASRENSPNGWWLIVSSNLNQKWANAHARKWHIQGYPDVRVDPVNIGDEVWYRVGFGGIKSEQAARQLQSKISGEQLAEETWIKKLDPYAFAQ